MTTGGEGGMLVNNDEALLACAWAYKDHGKDFELAHRRDPRPGFHWLHEDFGTNWQMTENAGAHRPLSIPQAAEVAGAAPAGRGMAPRPCPRALPGLHVPEPRRTPGMPTTNTTFFVRRERLGTGWDRDPHPGRDHGARRAMLKWLLPGDLPQTGLSPRGAVPADALSRGAAARRDQPDDSCRPHVG